MLCSLSSAATFRLSTLPVRIIAADNTQTHTQTYTFHMSRISQGYMNDVWKAGPNLWEVRSDVRLRGPKYPSVFNPMDDARHQKIPRVYAGMKWEQAFAGILPRPGGLMYFLRPTLCKISKYVLFFILGRQCISCYDLPHKYYFLVR